MEFTKEELRKVLKDENFDEQLLGDLYLFVRNNGALKNKDVIGIEEFINNPNYMKMSILIST